MRGLDIFPPTRDHSGRDVYKIARSKGADTILIVKAERRKVSERYVPPRYHPGKSITTGRIGGYGYSTSFATETITYPGYTTGGYTISEPSMDVSVQLRNTKNRETIWTAAGFSRASSVVTSFPDLTASVAETTANELSREGLIIKRRPYRRNLLRHIWAAFANVIVIATE